jgi:hypothetical protein
MTKEINKTMMVDEADPQALEQRHVADTPDQESFLEMYRSLTPQDYGRDANFVTKAIIEGVVPESIRYGVMRRNLIEAYRGVVKSTTGDFFYFNWSPSGGDFHLVPADDPAKEWEAGKLFKSCNLGCDLLRSQVQEIPDDEDEDVEKELPGAAVAPVNEEDYAVQQESMQHEAHPGSTQSALPDDPTKGKQWHEPLRRAADGLNQLAANDGEKHWSTPDLMKAYGTTLQGSAPTVQPRVDAVEAKYLQEVLGASPEQLEKGLRLAPRHRADFERWKATQLRGRMGGLRAWLERQK